jgi:23S rRNA maturation mini-RNase III
MFLRFFSREEKLTKSEKQQLKIARNALQERVERLVEEQEYRSSLRDSMKTRPLTIYYM